MGCESRAPNPRKAGLVQRGVRNGVLLPELAAVLDSFLQIAPQASDSAVSGDCSLWRTDLPPWPQERRTRYAAPIPLQPPGRVHIPARLVRGKSSKRRR